MGGYNGADECGSCRTWKVQLSGRKKKVFIKDEAQVASRVGGAERAVLYFGKLLFESNGAPSVNAYEVKASMVCLQCKNCDPYLSTSELSFLQWGAIQISIPLSLHCQRCLSTGLPPEMYTIWETYPWRFGEPCCLLKSLLTEMTASASILTIVAFTVERYIAICYPLRAQFYSRLSR